MNRASAAPPGQARGEEGHSVDSQDRNPDERSEPEEEGHTRRELSRKQFLVGGAAIGAAVGLGGAGFGLASSSQAAPLVPRVQVGGRSKKPDNVDVALLNGN